MILGLITPFLLIHSSTSLNAKAPKKESSSARRKETLLDTNWKFGLTNTQNPAKAQEALSQIVNIPHTWNNLDIQSGGSYKVGGGWYEKTISFNRTDLADHEIFLKFDAVSSVAKVYVNHRLLGEHKGGFSAFCFDASPLLHRGRNTIDVRADNSPRPDVIPINENLFAIFGGIYRPVHVIETPKTCISPLDFGSPGVFVDEKSIHRKLASINIRIDLQNFTPNFQKVEVTAKLVNRQGRTVAVVRAPETLPSGPIHPVSLHLNVKNPHLWNGRLDPYLYSLRTSVKSNTLGQDTVVQAIGLRRFSIHPGNDFYLNSKPYRLYGVCRHQDRKNEGNALSNRQQREDAQMIYDIGATAARLSHYQQSPAIYRAFDKNGVIVWAESPFVNASSGKESANAQQQYRELILQNYNHASIAFWGCCNEVYGKTAQSYVPTLIRKLVNEGHELDHTRFIAATSGTGNPTGAEVGYADVQGMNRYYGWYYGKVHDLESWFQRMKRIRPGLVYALTEYGAEGNLHQPDESLPSHVNPEGAFFPETYETWLHERSWMIIRRHHSLVASFVWNMFDFTVPGWNRGGMHARNMKGLVSYDRKVKKDAYYWYKANWSKSLVLHILNRRAVQRSISPITIEVFCNNGRPQLTLNGKPLPPIAAGINSVDWTLSNVSLVPGLNRVRASIIEDGKLKVDTVTWNYKPTPPKTKN